MAMITSFSPTQRERQLVRHKTDVTGFFGTFEHDGRRMVQIDTHGSSDRAVPGKLSQTIQLDEKSARELWEILGSHFSFK